MSTHILNFTTREDWLAERRNGIGASEVGALLLDQDGHPIHPYSSPHQVWLAKKGLHEEPLNDRMEFGLLAEDFVCRLFNHHQPGIRLARTGSWIDDEKPWHRCTPDRLIVARVAQLPGSPFVCKANKAQGGLKALLQIKTASFFAGREFSNPGTDEVPDWYLAQCQWELHVTGYELCVLGLLSDNQYRQFLIYRDDDLIAQLVTIVDRFWSYNILGDNEPAVTGHKKDREWLNDTYPAKNEERVISNDIIDAEVAALAKEKANLKRLTNVIEGRENRIKAFMQNAAVLDTSLGQITWKADTNGRRRFMTTGIAS